MSVHLIVGGPRSGQTVNLPDYIGTQPVMMPDQPLGSPQASQEPPGLPIPIGTYRHARYVVSGRIVRCLIPEDVREQDLHLHLSAILRPEALAAMEP